MKSIKIASILSGVSLLAASLMPISASALSTGSMTMDGAFSNNGRFSVIVYEDTGADTVTGAAVNLTFSQPVSNVSYDYSVGPFTAVDYSGAHNALGAVSGRNPLARVSFTLTNPGTVVADVSASGSYLWHVEGASVQDIAFEKGEAYFTYEAPAPQAVTPRTTATTPANTNATANAAAETPAATPNDTPAALSQSTANPKKQNTAKETKSSHVGLVTTLTALLVVVGAAIYWLVFRKRAEVAPVKAYKLPEATTAAKAKTTKKKPASKKK